VHYAGSIFRTEKSQLNLTTDDSKIAMDYNHILPGGRQEKKKVFATIRRLFVHEAYPGSHKRLVVEGEWWENKGTCPVTRNSLVVKNPNHVFNHSSKFVFIANCYPRPVAIWPHDPLDDLEQDDEKKTWFDVIDRNQEEVC
jgi:hypothetical protein